MAKTLEEKKEIASRAEALRAEGKTWSEIEAALNVSQSTIRSWLRHTGPHGPIGRPPAELRQVIRDEVGKALEPIKRALGVREDE